MMNLHSWCAHSDSRQVKHCTLSSSISISVEPAEPSYSRKRADHLPCFEDPFPTSSSGTSSPMTRMQPACPS
ncbi:unnamed protein product [Periconia digitata]|uniref:Uncharacterized protein n=1 Tax=Periconia digitata TaxID=1303443 RepID=A0A9W4XPB9_9PLEO|nr:unnamed protein product [Periconia digitata]